MNGLEAAAAVELTSTSAYDLATMFAWAAVALALLRAVRGPTLVDRVIAIDLMTMLGVSLVTFHAIRVNEPLLVDVVLSLAFVGFLATVAFARWIDTDERRRDREGSGQ